MTKVVWNEIVLDAKQQIEINGKVFPKIIRLESDSPLEVCCQWLKDNQKFIEDQLLEHGAIIFRNFPIETPQKFHDFLLSLEWNFRVKYTGGGGPRNIVIGPIYNSTDSPPEFIIPFHHEMAYLQKFPEKLIFYCDIVPKADGETPILYSNDIVKELRKINSSFVEKLKEKGVRYIRNVSSIHNGGELLKYQKDWQSIFETEDKGLAEKLARECGTEIIEWGEDDSMKLTTIKFDGIVVEQRTGLETWFNAICLLHPSAHKTKSYVPWDVVYGDFTPISGEDVQSAIDIMAKAGVRPVWHHHDMMLVDNRLAMHGRNSFTPPRQILAAFSS